MFPDEFSEGFHVSYRANSVPEKFTYIGERRPVALVYRRQCAKCREFRPLKGGKATPKVFICAVCHGQ